MSCKFDTRAIHAGQPNDEQTGEVVVPVYQTSTYGQIEPRPCVSNPGVSS